MDAISFEGADPNGLLATGKRTFCAKPLVMEAGLKVRPPFSIVGRVLYERPFEI
ncbi:MAG: hypothetical protein NVS9B5_34820 [Terriglobales bacterium]